MTGVHWILSTWLTDYWHNLHNRPAPWYQKSKVHFQILVHSRAIWISNFQACGAVCQCLFVECSTIVPLPLPSGLTAFMRYIYIYIIETLGELSDGPKSKFMDVTTLCRAVLHAPIKCNIPPVDSHDFSSFHDVLKTPCKNGNLKTQNRFEVGDFLGNAHFFQKLLGNHAIWEISTDNSYWNYPLTKLLGQKKVSHTWRITRYESCRAWRNYIVTS